MFVTTVYTADISQGAEQATALTVNWPKLLSITNIDDYSDKQW